MKLICKMKKARLDADKMTQAKLSEITGIDVTTISTYENNRRTPNALTVWILADAIGCHTDDLYELIKDKE